MNRYHLRSPRLSFCAHVLLAAMATCTACTGYGAPAGATTRRDVLVLRVVGTGGLCKNGQCTVTFDVRGSGRWSVSDNAGRRSGRFASADVRRLRTAIDALPARLATAEPPAVCNGAFDGTDYTYSTDRSGWQRRYDPCRTPEIASSTLVSVALELMQSTAR